LAESIIIISQAENKSMYRHVTLQQVAFNYMLKEFTKNQHLGHSIFCKSVA